MKSYTKSGVLTGKRYRSFNPRRRKKADGYMMRNGWVQRDTVDASSLSAQDSAQSKG